MLALDLLVVGCWRLKPQRAHAPTPRDSTVNPLGLAETATRKEQPGACYQVNIVVASVDGHMADDQVRTSSKVARGTPKWRSS
jgi:hypothetical protein